MGNGRDLSIRSDGDEWRKRKLRRIGRASGRKAVVVNRVAKAGGGME